VCANDFRHPVVLAKEVATLDFLSEGRFEFGMGAGYLPIDYATSGIPLESPGIRISRLAEALQIMNGLFAEGPVTFSGTYYTITELEGTPKPFQRPHPPLFIGGGSRRLLSLAGRQADIVGLIPPAGGDWIDFTQASLVATAQRIEWVRQAAGERFDAVELNTLVFAVIVTDHRQTAAEQQAAAWGTTAAQLLESTHFLVGTVDQMVEDIQMWRERFGISYVTVFPDAMEAFAPVVARLAGT
jgi:probable F420-dependent oxidoreductase